MKLLIIALVFSNFAFAVKPAEKKPRKTVFVPAKAKAVAKKEALKKEVVKKEEDCDDKAKKKVEIKEDSINLLGGTQGCTLE